MKFFGKSLFFMYALLVHIELITVFFFNLYTLYFLNLIFVMYILRYKYNDFSFAIFLFYTPLVLFITKLRLYDEVLFEASLFLNILDKIPFVNSEVMYALGLVHLLLLINLKKFDIFWAIIDEKLFRN